MTKLMDDAIDSLRKVPADAQDDVARAVLRLAAHSAVYRLDPSETADLDEADAEIERGEFASDEDVRTIWAKHTR